MYKLSKVRLFKNKGLNRLGWELIKTPKILYSKPQEVSLQERRTIGCTVGTVNEMNRLKWLEDVLKKIPSGSRILDAGAGELSKKKYCSHLNYVSQDFAQYDGVGDGKGLQTGKWDQTQIDIVSDITDLPAPDGSFDAIMCIEVFEHLPDPVSAIREFSRLLKQGGFLVISAPFCSLTHFAPYHFSTGFSHYYYEKHLSDNGFDVLEIKPNGNYFEYLAQEIRRLPEIAGKYADSSFSEDDEIAQGQLLYTLEKLSERDTGSCELLCHGWHVLARKKTVQ